MWTLQSTSTHKGPRGHVFSPCLKWKGPIHHRLFVTKTQNHKEYLCTSQFAQSARARVRLWVRYLLTCMRVRVCACVHRRVICTCQMHREDKRDRVMLFQQANTMTGTSTACTLLINLASRLRSAMKNHRKCSNKYVHFGCNEWASLIYFFLCVHQAKTIETKTNAPKAARRYLRALIDRDWQRYRTQLCCAFVHI